jgi:hypothetical protein
MLNTKELEKISRTIETFSIEDHIKILKIINDYDKSVISENNNGIFINMDDLSENTINKINDYVNYVIMKEDEIKEIENTKDKLKNDINTFHLLNNVETK